MLARKGKERRVPCVASVAFESGGSKRDQHRFAHPSSRRIGSRRVSRGGERSSWSNPPFGDQDDTSRRLNIDSGALTAENCSNPLELVFGLIVPYRPTWELKRTDLVQTRRHCMEDRPPTAGRWRPFARSSLEWYDGPYIGTTTVPIS